MTKLMKLLSHVMNMSCSKYLRLTTLKLYAKRTTSIEECVRQFKQVVRQELVFIDRLISIDSEIKFKPCENTPNEENIWFLRTDRLEGCKEYDVMRCGCCSTGQECTCDCCKQNEKLQLTLVEQFPTIFSKLLSSREINQSGNVWFKHRNWTQIKNILKQMLTVDHTDVSNYIKLLHADEKTSVKDVEMLFERKRFECNSGELIFHIWSKHKDYESDPVFYKKDVASRIYGIRINKINCDLHTTTHLLATDIHQLKDSLVEDSHSPNIPTWRSPMDLLLANKHMFGEECIQGIYDRVINAKGIEIYADIADDEAYAKVDKYYKSCVEEFFKTLDMGKCIDRMTAECYMWDFIRKITWCGFNKYRTPIRTKWRYKLNIRADSMFNEILLRNTVDAINSRRITEELVILIRMEIVYSGAFPWDYMRDMIGLDNVYEILTYRPNSSDMRIFNSDPVPPELYEMQEAYFRSIGAYD